MPSIPSLLDFSGLTTPARPSQARSGRPRDAGWRSRGTRFYCVGTIAFDHAIVDFEALSVVCRGQRYLFAQDLFLIVVRLLFAEGAAVSHARLAEAIGLTHVTVRSSTVTRHVQRLQVALEARGQGGLLIRRRGFCALDCGRTP